MFAALARAQGTRHDDSGLIVSVGTTFIVGESPHMQPGIIWESTWFPRIREAQASPHNKPPYGRVEGEQTVLVAQSVVPPECPGTDTDTDTDTLPQYKAHQAAQGGTRPRSG